MPERIAEVTTELGDGLKLQSVQGTESLSTPFAYDLDLISVDPRVDLASVLGTTMTVHIDLGDGALRHIHGVVTDFGQQTAQGRYMHYRAQLRPHLWLLSLSADCRIFQRMTVPDIVRQVLREHGCTDVEMDLQSYPTREYVVQYRESALNFVSRLLEEEGIYYFFIHEDGKHSLVLADSYSAHSFAPGYADVPYYPPAGDTEQRERDHLNAWSVHRQLRLGTYAMTDYDFTRPRADLAVNSPAPGSSLHSDYEAYDYPGLYQEVSQGERLARVRRESHQYAGLLRSGSGDVRGLAAGNLFKLRKHPQDAENLEYLILSASINIFNGSFESGQGDSGADCSASISALESSEPFRPSQTSRKPEVTGPQTATVVGPSGEEIWTDKYGRIKVQFHWDRKGASDENSSCWIRVAQQWAGSGFGSMHIPRIGNEVMVEFLEGDPDRPIITGRVYNAANMPPFPLPDNATQSGWRSRSTLGGNPNNCNELRFEDKIGAEQVYMQAEKDMDTLVKDAQTLTVGTTRHKEIGTDETVNVGANRTEQVGADETISIGANRAELVSGNENINIGGNRIEQVSGSETISIGSVQDVTIGTAASRKVGAAELVMVGGARETAVGGANSLSVGGLHTVQVGAAMATIVGGAQTNSVDGNQSNKVGSSRTVQIQEDDSLTVGKNGSVTIGKKLEIKAGDEVVVRTGSASLTLKKDGTILVKGKDITVQGSGKVNVKASGNVTIKGSKVTIN